MHWINNNKGHFNSSYDTSMCPRVPVFQKCDLITPAHPRSYFTAQSTWVSFHTHSLQKTLGFVKQVILSVLEGFVVLSVWSICFPFYKCLDLHHPRTCRRTCTKFWHFGRRQVQPRLLRWSRWQANLHSHRSQCWVRAWTCEPGAFGKKLSSTSDIVSQRPSSLSPQMGKRCCYWNPL